MKYLFDRYFLIDAHLFHFILNIFHCFPIFDFNVTQNFYGNLYPFLIYVEIALLSLMPVVHTRWLKEISGYFTYLTLIDTYFGWHENILNNEKGNEELC